MANNLRSQETRACRGHAEATNENSTPSVRLNDLPPDILYRIVSKLPQKEFARTSILSSEWRCMWSACPRLTFDAVELCKCDRDDLDEHTGNFISEVNSILQKYHGKVVETLEVRMDFFNNLLAHHIDTWVDFAVSSHTKSLTLDLKPDKFFMYNDRYVFPFQLFDGRSISRLQHMQLSFVSLIPPSQFRGFPNLRKLHLQVPHVNREDLEQVLSHCHNLEWLRLDRCFLEDELTVLAPLPRLLYLRVDWCKFTRIEFHAVNLTTFQYDGTFIPIDLAYSSKLQTANIDFMGRLVLQHALASCVNGLPSVQILSLIIGNTQLKRQWLSGNPQKFSNLKHLRLCLFLFSKEAENMVLYSVSFLRATPFIEKLEIHFLNYSIWLVEVGPCRKEIGECTYNYLKSICITGFKGARGQLEFLLHVVENAPALEFVSVKIGNLECEEYWPYEGKPPFEEAKQIATTHLNTILPQTVKFDVVY